MKSSNHIKHVRKSIILSHVQNTSAFQPNIIISGLIGLLVNGKGRSGFPSANNCQGQLQTPQSVLVTTSHILPVRR